MDLESKNLQLTDFLTQVPQHDIPILDQNQPPSSGVDTNTTSIDSKFDNVGIILVDDDGGELLHSVKDEVNKAKYPGLKFDFSADDVAYWIAYGCRV